MLNGIGRIFENRNAMLSHLKKKSYEKNTIDFRNLYGNYFLEMKDYVESAEDKEQAADEIGQSLVEAVKKECVNKRGKIDSRTQVDLNFFMIYYVFPTVLSLETEYNNTIAEGIRRQWAKGLKNADITYTDYDSLYKSFKEKIFGIF